MTEGGLRPDELLQIKLDHMSRVRLWWWFLTGRVPSWYREIEFHS